VYPPSSGLWQDLTKHERTRPRFFARLEEIACIGHETHVRNLVRQREHRSLAATESNDGGLRNGPETLLHRSQRQCVRDEQALHRSLWSVFARAASSEERISGTLHRQLGCVVLMQRIRTACS